MPRGMHKSRTLRKVFVKTPGGKTTLHYRKRKPSKAVCASCKTQLAGVPRERPYKMMNLPKTAKRPERPYGGVLCSPCTRKLMKEKARQAVEEKK
jgi:large subunit ribosomal protein L34e